jgi:TetR/AcrR family transcriptional regulator, mexJK operon transcriptional repressor
MRQHMKEQGARTQAKREQVLEGARQVFLREGFATASTDALAQEAGVSKSTLYVYYPSKEDLFVEVMRKFLLEHPQTQLLAFVQEMEPRCLEDLRVTLLTLAHKLLATIMHPEALALLRTIIADAHRFPQLTETLRSTIHERAAVEVSLLLERARINGVALRQGDTMLMTRLFVGSLMTYVMFDGLLHPQGEPALPDAGQIEAMVTLFLSAIVDPRELERNQ